MVQNLLQRNEQRTITPTPRPRRHGIVEWVLGIFGVIAAAIGAVILVGPGEDSVGLGGDWAWRIDDLRPAWGYGLLVGGVAVVLLAALLPRFWRPMVTSEPSPWQDVRAHAVGFLFANTFVWLQDLALGDGVNYAYWITLPWAIGLAAHAYARYQQVRAAATS